MGYGTDRIDQAAGMVSVQVGCTPHDAMILLSGQATDDGQTFDEIADAILDGTLRFDSHAAPALSACDGILILYALDEGQCELRQGCAVHQLRWTDHDAYLAAHARAIPEDQRSRTSV